MADIKKNGVDIEEAGFVGKKGLSFSGALFKAIRRAPEKIPLAEYVIDISKASGISCRDLRPDIDWDFLKKQLLAEK